MIARALDEWWRELGEPDPFTVVEAGAGRRHPGPLGGGRRAGLRAAPSPTSLVEQSAALRRHHGDHLPLVEQRGARAGSRRRPVPRAVLPTADPGCRWGDARRARDGVILANELLDNLRGALLDRPPTGWPEVYAVGGGRPDRRGASAGRGAGPGLRQGRCGWPTARRRRRGSGRGSRQREAAGLARSRAGQLERGRILVLDYAATTAALAARPVAEWLRTYRAHERGGAPLSRPRHAGHHLRGPVDQLAAGPPSRIAPTRPAPRPCRHRRARRRGPASGRSGATSATSRRSVAGAASARPRRSSIRTASAPSRSSSGRSSEPSASRRTARSRRPTARRPHLDCRPGPWTGRVPLTRERIIAAAVELVEPARPRRVSMRKLGRRAGRRGDVALQPRGEHGGRARRGARRRCCGTVPTPDPIAGRDGPAAALAHGFRKRRAAPSGVLPMLNSRRVAERRRVHRPSRAIDGILREAGFDDDTLDRWTPSCSRPASSAVCPARRGSPVITTRAGRVRPSTSSNVVRSRHDIAAEVELGLGLVARDRDTAVRSPRPT